MKNIRWHDSGREAQNPANPKYPDGVMLDLSARASQTCMVELDYPAKRVGHWIIECTDCGLRVACTAAGRRDDPRSVKLACKGH